MGVSSMLPGIVTIVCLYCSAVSTVFMGIRNNKNGVFSMSSMQLSCCCLIILLVAGGGAYLTATAP